MKITQYISAHGMERVEPNSAVRPAFVPAALAAKFAVDEEVDYYASPDKTRWVGICRARNFFAASKQGVAIATGKLSVEYPTLGGL